MLVACALARTISQGWGQRQHPAKQQLGEGFRSRARAAVGTPTGGAAGGPGVANLT